jgi:hypothetical protein
MGDPFMMERLGAGAMNVGIAVSFMIRRATEIGLGTFWAGMFGEEQLKSKLRLAVETRIVCLLAVGHPNEGNRRFGIAIPWQRFDLFDRIVILYAHDQNKIQNKIIQSSLLQKQFICKPTSYML